MIGVESGLHIDLKTEAFATKYVPPHHSDSTTAQIPYHETQTMRHGSDICS